MESKILNFLQSKQLIKSSTDDENILDYITDLIYNFTLRPETLEEDIVYIITNIKNDLFKNHDSDSLNKAIECFVHNEIYDEIMCKIKQRFSTDDLDTYEKCKYLSKINITPQQLGSKAYNIIPKLAMVELSLIDNFRSPMEKLNCISIVYDLIFAEMKTSKIAIISQYSDKEIDIPVIENKEILPILMAVIIKSKLMYLVSTFDYIKTFGKSIYENEKITRDIILVFEEAIEKITNITNSNFKQYPQLSPCLDVCETIKFVSENGENGSKDEEIYHEEKRRIQELITTATTQNLCNFANSENAK